MPTVSIVHVRSAGTTGPYSPSRAPTPPTRRSRWRVPCDARACATTVGYRGRPSLASLKAARRRATFVPLSGQAGFGDRIGLSSALRSLPARSTAQRRSRPATLRRRVSRPAPRARLPRDPSCRAFVDLEPDGGPLRFAHPTAGCSPASGRVRRLSPTTSIWQMNPISTSCPRDASSRSPPLAGGAGRSGLAVGAEVQVSDRNLIPRPGQSLRPTSLDVRSRNVLAVSSAAELVGLCPERGPSHRGRPARWAECDLAAERTIEARLPR